MTEWILSSSILILIVIALRTVFKGKISLRLQYVIWGLVLLRLLIPVSIGSTNFSVANLTTQTEPPSAVIQSTKPNVNTQANHSAQVPQIQHEQVQHQNHPQNVPVAEKKSFELSGYAVYIVWAVGFVSVACLFLITNFRFRYRILKSRYNLDVRKNNLNVYATGEIDTPCLFGIWNPAIYVTYPVADSQTLLRHTLEHEATHYRHGDHIWAVLRCICLAVHWYNPLVWWAAFLSQRDAELACDEATIKGLGEGERAEYGRTLISMTCQKKANVLITATTMTAGKSGIKERILLIAKKPKMAVYTLIAVVLAASIAVGCTFTGAKDVTSDDLSDAFAYGDIVKSDAIWEPENNSFSVTRLLFPRAYTEQQFLRLLGENNKSDYVYVAEYDNFFVDNREYDMDSIVHDNSTSGYLQKVLAFDGFCIWFVYIEYQENNQIWNLASIDLDGNSFRVHYSGIFMDSPNSKPFEFNNECVYSYYENQNAYYFDGKFVLSDKVKLVEYDISTEKVSEFMASEYIYPTCPYNTDELNSCFISISSQENNRIITPDNATDKGKAFGAMMQLKDNKIWDDTSALAYLFQDVIYDGTDMYIVCRVLNFLGETHIVVFRYLFETDEVHYCFNHFNNDVISKGFYIVPEINN